MSRTRTRTPVYWYQFFILILFVGFVFGSIGMWKVGLINCHDSQIKAENSNLCQGKTIEIVSYAQAISDGAFLMGLQIVFLFFFIMLVAAAVVGAW